MNQIVFYQFNEIPEDSISEVTVLAGCKAKWLYVRSEENAPWRIPSGLRREEETPDHAARRVLLEQGGAATEKLTPVCAYRQNSTGILYTAEICTPGRRLANTDRLETAFFDVRPERLDDPERDRAFFDRVQGWRNLQSAADELWDVYDRRRRKTGTLHRRGDPLRPGEYHLAVQIWIRRADGRFLLTRRAGNKGYPGLWECPGGSALAGDDSLAAALREAREETGVLLQPSEGARILSFSIHEDTHVDVWLFSREVKREDIVLQPGETDGAGFYTADEIRALSRDGKLVPTGYLERLFSITET